MKRPNLNGDWVMVAFALVVILFAYAAAANP